MGVSPQQRHVLETLNHIDLVNKEGWPTFREFVDKWIPLEMWEALRAIGGDRQSASSTAVIEMMYPVLIAAKSGNPIFELSPDIITALRDTEIPDFPMETLRVPFEGFNVDIPRGTFAAPADEVDRLIVCHVEGCRYRVVFNQGEYSHYVSLNYDGGTILESIDKTTKFAMRQQLEFPAYLRKELEEADAYENYFKSDVFRLAVNTTLYLTSPEADVVADRREVHSYHTKLQGVKAGHRREVLEKGLRKAKDRKCFIVGAKFRLSSEYKATLTETGKKWVLKHRVHVMGHWKWQVHGEKSSLRKHIFVKPYFKGPTYKEMIERGYVVR